MGKFFEEEASISGSDSGDDERCMYGTDIGVKASPQAIWNFINDEEYTQLTVAFTQSDEKRRGECL